MLPAPLLILLPVVALALALGSFLNVCIARLPLHLSIVRPASHCPRCGAPVRVRDNVPLLSWLLLRGRCRDCAKPISPRYPLVEAGYAALVFASVSKFGLSLEALAAAVFCFFALGLLAADLETFLLPDALTLPGALLAIVFALLEASPLAGPARTEFLGWRLLAGLGWTLGFLAIRWAYYGLRRRHGMGAGDVKLAGMLALWLGGLQMGVAVFAGVLGGALAGGLIGVSGALGRAALQEKNGARDWRLAQLPFGAFLCGGALLALFFGPPILKWYFKFFP